MSLYLKFAFRNLRRNFRRTLLTISGMAAGFTVLLWLQCILKGTSQQIVDNVTSTQVGHLQIWREEYVEDQLIQFTFTPNQSALKKSLPAGALSSERVLLPALVSSGEQSSPLLLTGVIPAEEAQITQIKNNRVEGEFLSEAPDPDCKQREIYLGKSMAGLLHVGLGDKVVIMAQATDGTLGNELFRVRGLFDTGSKIFDRGTAYAELHCVQKIGLLSGIHEIAIKLPQSADFILSQNQIRASIASVGDHLKLTSWKDVVPPLAGMVNFNDATLLLVSIVLFGVTTFGIINTLMMSVFERTREFGVMLALGATPTGVCLLVLLEALTIGLLAAVIGTSLGIVWVLYHQHVGFNLQPYLGNEISVSQFKLQPIVHPQFSFGRYFSLAAATIFFSTFAGLVPALQAARMNIIDAIKHR
jgi:ABC-type lipoprotein release transport system permease subunit